MGPLGYRSPIGEQPAGGLTAALDDVSGETALRETIVVVERPAERVQQRAERDRAVDAPPGDHHLRARVECSGDRRRAEVCVRGEHFGRERAAGAEFAHTFVAQRRQQRHDVVALDHGDTHRNALLFRQRRQCRGTAARIDATGVGDDPDAALYAFAQHLTHRHRDEVGRPARLGSLEPRAGENRHRQFSQIVEHEIIELSRSDQLRRGHRTIAPETRGTTDSHHLVVRHRSDPCIATRATEKVILMGSWGLARS